MKRFKLLVAALGVSLVAMLALAPTAQAQDTPTAIGDPLFVEAAGEATISLTGSGWIAGPVALVPCNASTYEALAAGGAEDCDTSSLTLATADADGNFTADFTLTVAAYRDFAMKFNWDIELPAFQRDPTSCLNEQAEDLCS